MKKFTLLLLSMLFVLAGFAKTTIPPKPVFSQDFIYRLPAPENSTYVYPDWYYEYPIPENTTYVFTREQGEGTSKSEALNRAIAQVIESTANRIGNWVNTADVHNAVLNGTDYAVGSRAMKIPIKKVCEFYIQDTKTRRWTVWILCQVAEKGNVEAEFEPFTACSGHTKFDKQNAWWKKCVDDARKEEIAAQKKEDGLAMLESFFVPGLGQMMKGSSHNKQSWMIEGGSTLAAEVVLFSIATGTYLGAKRQENISKQWGIDIDTYNAALKQKKVLLGTSYAFFGLAVAAHGINMYRAYTLRENKNYAVYPVIIPTDNQNLAYGIGATIKF